MKYSKLLPSQIENLTKIIEEHVKITRQDDDEWRGHCPFCHGGSRNEATFCVEISTGLSICHRMNCGWKGNAVSFVSELLGLSYEKATSAVDGVEDLSMAGLITLLDYDNKIPFKPLTNDAWIKGAYKALKSPTEVIDWIVRRGYGPDEFMALHDLWQPPDGLYRGRVIFKVQSKNILAYQLYDTTGKMERKTINPEGEFLSRTLYKYNDAIPIHDLSKDFLLIHEGIFDCARTLSRGYNAVSIFGTNLSSHQEELLRQHQCKELVVCLDGDTQNKNLSKDKAWAIAKRLSENTSKLVSIMRLPIDQDPDSVEESTFDTCFDQRLLLQSRSEWLFESL